MENLCAIWEYYLFIPFLLNENSLVLSYSDRFFTINYLWKMKITFNTIPSSISINWNISVRFVNVDLTIFSKTSYFTSSTEFSDSFKTLFPKDCWIWVKFDWIWVPEFNEDSQLLVLIVFKINFNCILLLLQHLPLLPLLSFLLLLVPFVFPLVPLVPLVVVALYPNNIAVYNMWV